MVHTQSKIFLFFMTNLTAAGEIKTADYYASHFLPAAMAAQARAGERIMVVDVNHEKNQNFFSAGASYELFGFTAAPDYSAETYAQFAADMVPIDLGAAVAAIPYTSGEAPPVVLDAMGRKLPALSFINAPAQVAKLSSKASLADLREQYEALRPYILPNIEISDVTEYSRLKAQFGGNIVLRVPRSTEGNGVYIDRKTASDLPRHGGIDGLLERYESLVVTPCFPVEKTGDSRVFTFRDADGNLHIEDKVGRRIAASPTKDNPCPKCNVAAGGRCEVVDLTQPQREAVFNLMGICATIGIHHAGVDIFGDGTQNFSIPGAGKYSVVISEINFSPDAHNQVSDDLVEKLAASCLSYVRG